MYTSEQRGHAKKLKISRGTICASEPGNMYPNGTYGLKESTYHSNILYIPQVQRDSCYLENNGDFILLVRNPTS